MTKQAAQQPTFRGSILDADPPAYGVNIAGRMTLWQTMLNILTAKDMYDPDSGDFASRRKAQEPVGYVAPETLTQLQAPNGYGYVVAAPAYTTSIPLYTAPPSPAPAGDLGATYTIEHDGFTGTVVGTYTTREGKEGVNLQQVGTRVVHVYGRKWLKPAEPTPAGEVERLRGALQAVEPFLDAIVCYASTTSEHKGNRVAALVRSALNGGQSE